MIMYCIPRVQVEQESSDTRHTQITLEQHMVTMQKRRGEPARGLTGPVSLGSTSHSMQLHSPKAAQLGAPLQPSRLNPQPR